MKEWIKWIIGLMVFTGVFTVGAFAAASIFGDIATFSNNTYFWGNTTNMPRNISGGRFFGELNCTYIFGGSDTDFCVDATGGGGGGENFWRVEGGWMSPNITAGGDSDVNATNFNATGTMNATQFFENVVALTDKYLQITDTIDWGNISNRNLNIAWTGNLLWGNISGRSLNILWTDKLSWGNLSEYNLNTAWSGTLLGGNITGGSITSSQLTANLGLGWNNLTDYPSICSKDQWVKQIGDALTCVQPDFGNISGSLLWGNLTGFNLNSNWAGSLYYGNLSGAYSFNSSYNAQLGQNTTSQIRNAINNTGLWYNISVNESNRTYYVFNTTERNLFTEVVNSSYITSEAEPMYNANYSSILKSPLTLNWWNISNPTLAVTWNGTLGWGNLSQLNLNSAWSGKLYYGNLSGAYSFNSSYDAKAQTGSCTNQFITATTSTAAPSCNSVTNSYLTTGIFATIQGIGVQSQTLDMGKNSIINVSAISIGLGNITTGIASVTFNMGGFSVTNASWVNATNVNATKVYVNTTCYTPDCLRNTTFNGTCVITYSTSSILEIC